MRRGRPKLFPGKRQMNVLLPIEDYQALRARLALDLLDHPAYSIGDLIRDYIRRGLKGDGRPVRPAGDPRADRIRQLNGIARTAVKLARELKKSA